MIYHCYAYAAATFGEDTVCLCQLEQIRAASSRVHVSTKPHVPYNNLNNLPQKIPHYFLLVVVVGFFSPPKQ